MLTALYGMDPAEINFPNRSGGIGGGGAGLFTSSPEATRLTASKDKGLRTLLAFLEDCMNDNILPLIDPTGDFEFTFIGFDSKTDSERLDADDKASRTYKTINEIREAHGLETRDDCDVIRDPTWLQAKQMSEAPQAGEGGGGGEGEPGVEGQGGAGGEEQQWALPEEPEEGDLW